MLPCPGPLAWHVSVRSGTARLLHHTSFSIILDTVQVAGSEVASAMHSLLPVVFEAPRPDSAANAALNTAAQPSAAQAPPVAKPGSAGAQAAAQAPAAAADAVGSPSGRAPVNWAAKVRQPELQAGLVRVLAAAAQHEGARSALAPAAVGPGDTGAAALLSMLFNLLEAETPKLPEPPAEEAPAVAGQSLLCTCRSQRSHHCGLTAACLEFLVNHAGARCC